jgi:Na+-translocating ferredoxin:NAD+ oxidoreductase subunit B
MELALATAILIGLSCALWLTTQRAQLKTTDIEKHIEQIEDLLPQTQCGQCGHMGCRPYAEAIAHGEAINRCPPGGERTIKALAQLLHTEILPLDIEGPPPLRTIAYIREDECIGCTKCIQACPVDAIVGAAKLMHTVIAAECTGCDLCVEPCPVDCIEMRPLPLIIPSLIMRPPKSFLIARQSA